MLDILNSTRRMSVGNGDVIDLGGGLPEVVMFTTFNSDVLTLEKGDTDTGDDLGAVTGGDASNAGGAAGMLVIQIIRPIHRYLKVALDAGGFCLCEIHGLRNEGVTLDATIIEAVSLNSPDPPNEAGLRPDGYPEQAPI